ncbi:MAG TPA: hypothetical protein VJV75_03815 [Candidatus Polarisedimenticolia bacterium]|nr:hypothetical protein [Candidatus Polarisedimenticolia bacterium]
MLTRSIGKLDAVVAELPPDVRDGLVSALRDTIAATAGLGERIVGIVATLDPKAKKQAVKAVESFGWAIALTVIKGGGFDGLGAKLAGAAGDAPNVERALLAAVPIDVEAVPTDGKGG